MTLTNRQSELDVEKWLKSEKAGRDLCGDFEFCALCDKDAENPCATAYEKMKKSAPKKRMTRKSKKV